MVEGWDLLVRVHPASGDEREEVAALALRLRAELLELDVDAVQPESEDIAPDGSKSVSGLVSMLTVQLGKASLIAVFTKIRDWVSRSGRSVEVTIDGDTVKVTGATQEQQEKIINVWLARHAPTS